MPYLKIQTNKAIDETSQNALMKKASATISAQLGKPVDYIMVAIDPPRPMIFAGNNEPTAYLELKSIGLSASDTTDVSSALCNLVSEELSINKQRIYIEFTNSERSMWGWNGATF